ncbi:MAG: sugar ABC transporter substrate-binding protein [Propionibacteriaceae bacterium]
MTLTRRMLIGGALGAAATTALAACGGSDQPSGDSGGNGAGSIRFSIWFGEGDIDVWKAVIAGFQKANPDITVKFEPQEYANFWTKLNTQLAGGSAPDVIGMQFQQASLGPSGQLEPLDEAMAGDISKMPDTLVKIGQATKDGKTAQYALPWRFVGSSLYGNTSAMEKAGITVPSAGWTLDDFVAAAKELTQGSSFGTQIPGGGAQVPIASTFGAVPVSEDGKTATFNTPEMAATKAFFRDLIYVHKVAPAPKKVSAQKDPFATDQIRMTFQGSWMTPVYRSIKNFEWDILPNPSGQQPAKNYAGPDMISVYAKSKNKVAAEKFVQYAVFDRAAQELIGKTGAPVLADYLTDQTRVDAEAKLKPANYGYFVKEATDNGEGWGFVPKFADIGKLEADADYEMYTKPDSDIPSILNALNTKVQAALDSTR